MIRERIKEAIEQVLGDMRLSNVPIHIERPPFLTQGDYSTNVALIAAKIHQKNPQNLAEDIAQKLSNTIRGVDKIEVARQGFINFFLSREALAEHTEHSARDPLWGVTHKNKGQIIMVEYTDPNPFKEFHIGHLMSNAIGESIARLLDVTGAHVIRVNYQGDVGLHVAKALWAMRKNPRKESTKNIPSTQATYYGEMYALGAKQYEENPEAKKEIDDINRKVYEKSDETINKIYKEGREWSLRHFEALYTVLGTKFDYYFFESETGPKGVTIVRSRSQFFEQSDGAVVFRGEKYDLHTRVFINSLGLPTYEAKELGLIELKREVEPSFTSSITITANEQDDYFKVVLKAAELIFPDLSGKIFHRSHGMMRFAQGKMSSRTGNVITGELLLETLKNKAMGKMQDRSLQRADVIAQKIAVGAVKYVILRRGSNRDIIFDPEKALSLEGDSGPYLQYAHTRVLSLLGEIHKVAIDPNISDVPNVPVSLERILLHFSTVLERCALELEPHHLVTYLTELAATFNSWYSSERIIGGEYPHYGALISMAVEQTLRSGLSVLGIPVPEEM